MTAVQRYSILTRVLTASVIGFLLLTLVFHFSLRDQQMNEVNVHIEDSFRMLEAEIASQIVIRSGWMNSAALMLQGSNNSYALLDALVKKRREALYLLASNHYQTLKKNNQITHLYFMDENLQVVLRMHQPDRYGDIVDRSTARQAASTGEMARGIELGLMGSLILRVVVPWKQSDKVMGYVELGIELEEIISGIAADNPFQVVLVVNKEELDRGMWRSGRRMLKRPDNWMLFNDVVALFPSEVEPLIPIITTHITCVDNSAHVSSSDGVDYGVKHVPFLDNSGEEIGKLMMLLDLSMENVDLNHGMFTAMATFVLLIAIFICFLYLLITRSERGLRSAERRLELYGEAIANTLGGVIITDNRGSIIDVNAAFEKVTGYSKEEATGQNPSMLKSGQQDELFYHSMWKTLMEDGQWQGRIFNRRKNGEVYPEHLSITAIKDAEGEVKNYIGVFLDVSEQELLEEQFRQAQRMESLGTLVGGIAHEFNNMLAGMTGNLYLALGEVKALPAVVEKLKTVESLSFQAGEMIKQLLTFARKGTMVTEETNLALFLKSSGDLFRLAVPEDISLQFEITDSQSVVNVDRAQLQQVLMNLINNAKSALQGVKRPEINISLERYSADEAFLSRNSELTGSDFARISVADNGEGIAKRDLDKIFEPFFTTKRVGEGAGLGLSMVFGAIKGYGGAVEVESKRRKGTTLHLYIPVSGLMFDDVESGPSVVGNGETILVVDDEPLVIETACKVLRRLGYEVLAATSGRDAIALFKQHEKEIGLVMLDVVMPDMSGPETADLIHAVNGDVMIIFATGYDMTDTLEKRVSQTGETVLRKPYHISKLSQLLNEILKH